MSVNRERRVLRIGGQGPRLRWKPNPRGAKRTIEEAIAIARRHGVEIPDDVVFFEAEPGMLEGSMKEFRTGKRFETAIGPRVQERPDGRVYWHDHFNKEGRIPFRVHPDILTSDEAIVAVLHHEMFELRLFKEVFDHSRDKSMDGTDYWLQTSPGRRGNFHDQAWSEADRIISRIRRRPK